MNVQKAPSLKGKTSPLSELRPSTCFRQIPDYTDFTSPNRIFMVVYSSESGLLYDSKIVYGASLETGHVASFDADEEVEVVGGVFHYTN